MRRGCRDIVDTARTVEAVGYTSLWTSERVLSPVESKELQDWFTTTGQMLETAEELHVRATRAGS